MIQLHNTLSRKLEKLQPLHKDQIRLYTCGMTVYDYPQLGNWATYIRWDTLVRMLRESDYDVAWVMNITDVGHLTSDADEGEDKLEKGAKREGKSAWEIADFYTKMFMNGMAQLNITTPSKLPKATDHIPEQLVLLETLEKKGFTYVIDDGVYFDTSKLPDYGKLTRQKAEDLRAGARVELNAQKRNITDFALWKFSPKDQQRDMEWDSKWGKGFPGWHLECSAIAMKYLGETLDIHAGGVDHIAVHHTNEIAQSEAATGKPFANIWLHSNFITVDGVKLSKSLNNSFNLFDIQERGFDPLVLRVLFLQSHYRAQANFSWEAMEAARNRLQSLRAMADLRWQYSSDCQFDDVCFEETQMNILQSLQDDLNSPLALAHLSQLEQLVSECLVSEDQARSFETCLEFLDRTLGLNLLASSDITDDQKLLIAMRETARSEKNFAESDRLRDELKAQGVALRDTKHGPIWYRV